MTTDVAAICASFGGMRLIETPLMTVGPFEDWSQVRSPGRARRRRGKHRQRIRFYHKPDPKLMIAETTPPPPLEGRVVDYVKEKKGNTELVEVSLGSDDGLSVGHTMTVYNREGRYLGQIRLTLVNADKAVGIVTLKEKNTVIQKGDNVTTKL